MVQSLTMSEKELRPKVATFRRAIESTRAGASLENLLANGRELHETLIAPAAESLATAERILVVPDGPLHLLPFAALVAPSPDTERPWRYLVEWKPVHVAASVTVWEELKKDRPAAPNQSPTTLLAFGDPLYPSSNTPATARHPDVLRAVAIGGGLRPLPATRDEVLAIADLFGEHATTLLGPEATEERAKSAGNGPRLIHFAAHGILDPQVPLDSAIALSIPENPQDGRDNGLLQAWEIFESLRIEADLVTLSGCETALGQELPGEGIVGLTRAFQYAGARTVLASLWSVTDRSTAELMKRFYGYLRDGQTKDQALRSAQIDMIRASAGDDEDASVTRGVNVLAKGTGSTSYASPFYWAAFQLFGDWR
jgi:CHAT domain-containing protein